MNAVHGEPERRERMPAHGASMFPFVPAGSMLGLRPRGERAVETGDIVCYPGSRGEVVAHRVLARRPAFCATAQGPVWITRGDALRGEEHVAESAIAWVVDQVEHRGFSYRTDGLIGRLCARIAVRRGALYFACTHLAHLAVRLRRASRPRPSPTRS